MFKEQQLTKELEKDFPHPLEMPVRYWTTLLKRLKKILTEQKEKFLSSDRYICLQEATERLAASWFVYTFDST